MNYTSPPGVFDILPEDSKERWKSSYFWIYLEEEIRKLAATYGYSEIRTPLFEKTELLSRGVGETSDIVKKEMYTFEDRGGRSLTLRPEGTAPVIRALIENNLLNQNPLQRLYYIAPMFRYERAQAGRYRQHHQFGVEAIGSESPELDAEVIDMAYTLYKKLGLHHLTLYINSLGSSSCRLAYRTALKEYLEKHLSDLSPDSQERFQKNPLRILDSKEPGDRALVASAPKIVDYLNEESLKHFDKVKYTLQLLGIPFEINPLLVRGLDYYNKTVFEITSGNLGAQNSIGGGGRYDGLIKLLGGPDLPAVGFGTGMERILQTLLAQTPDLSTKKALTLFLIPIGEKETKKALLVQKELRDAGISVQTDYSGKKLNRSLGYANQIGAKYVGILGDQELNEEVITLKEMASGTSTKVPFAQLKCILEKKL